MIPIVVSEKHYVDGNVDVDNISSTIKNWSQLEKDIFLLCSGNTKNIIMNIVNYLLKGNYAIVDQKKLYYSVKTLLINYNTDIHRIPFPNYLLDNLKSKKQVSIINT